MYYSHNTALRVQPDPAVGPLPIGVGCYFAAGGARQGTVAAVQSIS
ncbi:MAG TPA: hypothetical protein VE891_09920 [Allosphingosinicella sp.]|nr:hypothetical protein [Allosphingosinicella sp.]